MSASLLKALGLGATNSGTYLGNGTWSDATGAGVLNPANPTTGEVIAQVQATSEADYETVVANAQAAFKAWRTVPAPRRGEAIRLCGEALRANKDALGSLVAPAAVLGAALGFGAQRIVQDLLSGFFIITEKQYGFGDLVTLTLGASNDATGTVEDVTLRITKLRTSDGEVFTVPNGQIMKSLNLSKDWARAVVDIPVPTSADLNAVNELLHAVCENAMKNPAMSELLLDQPQLMGVESLELDTVNLRMVARTLPGKQFEVGRQLRLLVIAALARAGIVSKPESTSLAANSEVRGQ